jgi:hypothetical protein
LALTFTCMKGIMFPTCSISLLERANPILPLWIRRNSNSAGHHFCASSSKTKVSPLGQGAVIRACVRPSAKRRCDKNNKDHKRKAGKLPNGELPKSGPRERCGYRHLSFWDESVIYHLRHCTAFLIQAASFWTHSNRLGHNLRSLHASSPVSVLFPRQKISLQFL